MNTPNFENINEMWGQAAYVMVAPEGFKQQCDRYIGCILSDVLKTNKFIVSDDKYDTGIQAILYQPTTGGRGTFCCLFIIDNRRFWFEELQDYMMYNITRTINQYVEGRDFSNISIVCDEEGNNVKDKYGNFIPQRNIEGLIVRPIINDTVNDKPVDAFYVSMDDFYQATDEQIIKMFTSDKKRLLALFDNLSDILSESTIRRSAYRLIDEGLRDYTDNNVYLYPCGKKNYAVFNNIIGEYESAVLLNVFKKATSIDENEQSIMFSFSNGVQDTLDTINLAILKDVLYTFEYRTQCNVEENIHSTAKQAEDNNDEDFVNYATHYIYDIIYNILKTSRFAQIWYNQYLPLMDKENQLIGKIADIVCKGEELTIEYYPCNEYYDCSRNIKTFAFKDASTITIKHIMKLIGECMKEYENGTNDYSCILYVEDEMKHIRVPYRVVKGTKVTMNGTYHDEDMKELAKRHSITNTAINAEFFGNFEDLDIWYNYKQ